MEFSILDFFAERNAGFLHGGGRQGTAHLLDKLALKGDEKVFEIGCGTGATLVTAKSLYPDLELSATEPSPKMYEKAKQRLKFCGLPEVRLFQIRRDKPYPFPDHSLDLVYTESVLAILEQDQLDQVLDEISRILKPGGKLAMNETIWLPDVRATEIERINTFCRARYGIIQSNGQLADIEAWTAFLVNKGFRINYCCKVEANDKPLGFHLKRFGSRLFSIAGKLKSLLVPNYRERAKELKKDQQSLLENGSPMLNAYIIIAQKK